MERTFVLIGAMLGFLGVGLGAFGAHGLPDYLARHGKDPAEAAKMLANWETASRYQMYHALAVLFSAWAYSRWPGGMSAAAGWLFLAGTLIFSGTLYTIVLSGLRWLGMITPIGGLLLMAGWICLALAAFRAK